MKQDPKYRFIVIFPVLILLAVGMMFLGQKVNAAPAADGAITGLVKLDGTPPHMRGIDMTKDPWCAKQHADNPAHLENVLVGKNGGLENVVVYISQGYSGPKVAEKSLTPVFDQKNCVYAPHVLAMDINQQFKVITSDQTAHNIHPDPNPMTGNIPWNRSQPPGAPPILNTWKAEEVAIPVKCNIHPWMHGYFVVVKGPNGTTNEDGGYTIKDVPPGSYTLTAWHEEYGKQTAQVTVAAGKPATADFTFKAK